MDKIKVLLADDEKMITRGLRIILETYEDIVVIGEASNGEEALHICRINKPHVVLMDIRMEKCDGVLGTRLIKKEFSDVKILILTTFNDMDYIHEALEYGASGYILKESDYDSIYQSIKACVKGNVVVNPEVASKIINENVKYNIRYSMEEVKTKFDLSDREINIIKEIAKGLSNKEIGERLFLSEGTIKNNISCILSKLALIDRTQLTIFAFKNNIAEK